MGSSNGNNATRSVGNYVNSPLNRNLSQFALGPAAYIGGSSTRNFLADPLGLFGGGGKKPPITSTDAQGNPLIGGLPYDPNKIYTNPAKAEAARQIAIKQGTGRVNEIFDSPERAAQHADFLKAIREFYTTDANKQKQLADRGLKFSMARSGLTGGSAANDANVTLGEEYTKGLLGAEQKAQGAFSDLNQQDEQSRLNLLNMVRQGMDVGTASQRAAGGWQANAASAQANAMTQGLGDIFGQTAKNYQAQIDAQARRQGTRDAYGSFYGAGNPYLKTWG
jgi:hypothetical protein